jgi:transcriptional regulator with XRE-family HTH domain
MLSSYRHLIAIWGATQGASETRWVVARNVRCLRREQHLSQEALAGLAGMHRTFIGHVERAETNVSLDTLDRVADALGFAVSVLST